MNPYRRAKSSQSKNSLNWPIVVGWLMSGSICALPALVVLAGKFVGTDQEISPGGSGPTADAENVYQCSQQDILPR